MSGDQAWRIPAYQRSRAGEVELFCDRDAVTAGAAVQIYVSGRGRVRLSLWRLGYEGGTGGRLVADLGWVDAEPQAPPTFGPDTGLVSCAHWHPTASFMTDGSWPSGVYAIRADRGSGEDRTSTDALVTMLPSREHDVIVVLPVTTWAAYNAWGGRSLYDGGGFTGLPRAVEVSFDRPMKPTGSPIWELTQGHPFFTWEYPLVRWLEREGFDVGYVTNLELHRGELPARHLVVSAGHDEYWSVAMRDTLDAFLQTGRHLFWAGANGMCWNVRLSPSPVGTDRTITCYKDHLADPMWAEDPANVTGRWGEWPLYRSESEVLGLRWVDWDFALNRRPAAWVVRAADHPVFTGTGLRDGDRIDGIVGDEWDALDSGSFGARYGTVLGETDELVGANLGPSRGHTLLHRNASGGLVLATGTTSWCWGLDTTTVEDRVTSSHVGLARLTRNYIVGALEGADW